MKITYIELLGEQHPMCFSLAASEALAEKFGGLENMDKALSGGDIRATAKAVDTILAVLLKAGRTYVAAMGGELPPEIPCRPADLIDVADGAEAIKSMFSAIKNDTAREVEAKSKNAGATQEK